MSRTGIACCVLVTSLCVVRSASSQNLERLRDRADSLVTLWRDAQLVVTLQDSLRRTSLPSTMERVEAGPLVVFADPSRLPLQEATTAAWEILEAYYGDAAQTVAGHPVVLRVVDELRRSPNEGAGVRIPKKMALKDLALTIARTARVSHGDPALLGWLGMALMPGDDPARERRVVYVELVTAPWSVTRRCFEGDHAACVDALELVPLEGAVQRWWTPAERRRIVATNYASYYLRNRPALRALTTSCVQNGVDSACLRLLEEADPRTWPRPLSPVARAALVRLALERGGRSSYARLLADSTRPVPERLATVARVPLDSLVDVWRELALSSRPKPVDVPWGNATVALGWLGVLMACALRSSRWRLG